MKKIFTILFSFIMAVTAFAQWSPAAFKGKKIRENVNYTHYFSVDVAALRAQLSGAVEMGSGAKPVQISVPTADGNLEKFNVYSFPVMVKELADKYQLGSYTGVSATDPLKFIRFSLAPNDFQSMVVKNGEAEFVEPVDSGKTVYGTYYKTNKSGDGFFCSTSESASEKRQIEELKHSAKNLANKPGDFSRMSDKKYRTLRLAMSVTGEYTTYFGGTVAGALAAINATLTRVNGVFEKDFATHLNLQNFPNVIYTNAATDPYSPAAQMNNWNQQLQTALTTNVGDANYDIGHLFGASGGGGNAGCIGCVCVSPTTAVPKGKGSGFTSPADGIPQGDNFDIDYVAHEMGHQLGGNHTFSHSLEGSGVQVEPGSGSTIMGYAGITNVSGQPQTDVQAHSDPYFSFATIKQVQANLISKTCDVETAVTNNPPVIAALSNYTIPKGTAFVLTAAATDPENDPITYDWEEADDALVTINANNLGTTTSGASFRSMNPVTTGIRYFPRLSSVLNGVLDNSNNLWESVSKVARASKYAVTVRDNNAVTTSQQSQTATTDITVGADGPFKVMNTSVYNNGATAILWDVANTAAAPYNSPNVAIDYTTNNGTTWTVITASTPNNGSFSYTFPATLAVGSTVKIRVKSVANVFYAIGITTVKSMAACSTTAAPVFTVSGITSTSAIVSWDQVQNATYVIRYRAVGSTVWTTVPVSVPYFAITGLSAGTYYEVQVANVCSGTQGAFSASTNFFTPYCEMYSASSEDEYISNVTVTPNGAPTMTSNSGASTYTAYYNDATRLVTLVQGNPNNTISVSKGWTSTQYNEAVQVWVDFNHNGQFEDSEKILNTPADKNTPVTATFTVPATAVAGYTGMRVVLSYSDSTNPIPATACTLYGYGEVEDYLVNIITPPCTTTAPTGVSVTAITNTSANVTWTSVPATSFSIRYRPVGSTTWTTVTSTTNNITLTGLTPTTQYEVQVATVCGTTVNTYSASVLFTTLTSCVTTAPTNIMVSSITTNSAVATWTAVGASYIVQYRKVGTTAWTTVPVSTNTITMSSLTPGTQYEVQVATVCGSTTGAFSASTNFTTLCVTTAPTNVAVTNITTTTALVTWDATPGISSYSIQYRKVGTLTWTTVTSNTNSVTLNGLLPNSHYEVQVANACGTTIGTYSTPVPFNTQQACVLTPPTNLVVNGITSTTAQVDWDGISTATYILRYRKLGTTTWTSISLNTNSYLLTGLTANTQYEVEVAYVCTGTTGSFTGPENFTTLGMSYCQTGAVNSTAEYIKNVTVTPVGPSTNVMANTSGASSYSDYSGDTSKVINLIAGSTGNVISVEKGWQGAKFNETVTAWIDFNSNGIFETSERIMMDPANQTSPVEATFTVPATAAVSVNLGNTMVMRVALSRLTAPVDACTPFANGEVEDYPVRIYTPVANPLDQNTIFIYPNPVSSILFVSKVSNNAEFTIYNAAGQLMKKGKIIGKKIDVSSLGQGVYVIDITDGGENLKTKFIKQ